ncbi:hypothetical protein ABZ835_48090 [Streptomyces sp. NPDC047461]|uniref:hypothetical protein n=1 Tax=Streptomyces sp. NPDC047461 TaxID=3155619 RepID=UPI0034081A83
MMDGKVAISLLQMAAADRTLAAWQRPSDAQLVQLGLDALMAGVESPSLALLAGLARNEFRLASELFDLATQELDLLPLLPDDLNRARWTAARWWAHQIAAGDLDPVHGANLIWLEAAAELGYPEELQQIVDLAIEIAQGEEGVVPQGIRHNITNVARAVLSKESTGTDRG